MTNSQLDAILVPLIVLIIIGWIRLLVSLMIKDEIKRIRTIMEKEEIKRRTQ